MLDWFELDKFEEKQLTEEDGIMKSALHIYLKEKDNRQIGMENFRPNGYTESTDINDFPVRDRKLVLHVRRRRWLSPDGRNVVLNVYPLVVSGTHSSEEFAAFLKERLGYIPDSEPLSGDMV